MNYAHRAGSIVIACMLFAVVQTLFAPLAYATGESYQYDRDSKTLYGNGGGYLELFGLADRAVFTYEGTDNGIEIFSFQERVNALNNNCNNSLAYVKALVNTNSKVVTQVIDGCGTYAGGEAKDIQTNFLWSENVSYTNVSTGGNVGSTDISGTPTYAFVSSDQDGTTIEACDGFYKQFNSEGCILYSLLGDTGAAIDVGDGSSSLYYKATGQVSGDRSCTVDMYIALPASRTITDGAISGHAGYAIFSAGTNLTNNSNSCGFIKPSNHSTYTTSPGVPITITGADAIESINGAAVESSSGTTTCAVEGIGWVVCPVMNFIGKLNDIAFDFLSTNLLETEPSLMTNEAIKTAWENFRDIANALFVIAFLFIVYGQMVGGRN